MQYLSIHAHFYQPPREDPLNGIIPRESGAAPYANWNERIHNECYRPNAELRNFERISFNIGPTLFAWMQSYDPQTARSIIEQDKANVRRNGVGNALAQAYNHTILPLATRRDKEVQIAWGIADFRHRFGRNPQGMWLPETAVDLETLETLAQAGIRFTILAPWQSESELSGASEPGQVSLPGDRQITVFFYQRDLSTRISFDPAATVDADRFARELILQYAHAGSRDGDHPRLLLLASDGELYGHHQSLRERFLARLVDGATQSLGIEKTYPGLWLAQYPPEIMVEIREGTSWSCHHGVQRWTGACTCHPGHAGWKEPLRLAFNHLAEGLDQAYEETTRGYIPDPQLLLKRYVHVLLGELTAESLVCTMAGQVPKSEAMHRIQLALEMQRERQRMFTSCGWFYDDFDRIEACNNLAYAAQAVHLAELVSGDNLERRAARDLSAAVSERSGRSAAQIFERNLQRIRSEDPEQ